jgi:hypothetical protein
MVNKMARLTTQQQIDEVAFFDGKINIAIGLIATLLLGYGQTAEEILLHSVGETIAVHDSGVAVWKNKLQNSRIRPTTVIQALYPERRFTINNNISLRGKHFQALVRTMPHSEFPSGSSCVCQAIDEYTTDLWPHFNLTSQGMPVSFDPASTPVILPSALLPRIPATNAFNPSPDGYTAQTLSKRCGETREEGGMHFTPSVPAGRELCAGMGTATAAVLKTLVPGVVEGTTTIRSGLGSTSACGATCCAEEAECSADQQGACAAECTGTWDLPWFDVVGARVQAFGLPARANAMAPPFAQMDRQHLMVVGTVMSLVPDVTQTETIYQFRYTSTIDNLMWNAVAANSASLLAIKFGQSKVGQQPTIRSDMITSDARVATAVHAVAGALTVLLPAAKEAFEASLAYAILAPNIGIDSSLSAACGALEDSETAFSAGCLLSWYVQKPGPARLGQTIAWELMFHKVRDGWNSLGTDGECDAGPHFCPCYMDTTGYDPESGACTGEVLSRNA